MESAWICTIIRGGQAGSIVAQLLLVMSRKPFLVMAALLSIAPANVKAVESLIKAIRRLPIRPVAPATMTLIMRRELLSCARLDQSHFFHDAG